MRPIVSWRVAVLLVIAATAAIAARVAAPAPERHARFSAALAASSAGRSRR